MTDVLSGNPNVRPDEQAALAAHAALLPAMERRLASLLPLILHDGELLEEEIGALSTSVDRLPRRDGYTFWPELLDWCVWWLGTTMGAFAVREGRLPALVPLFQTRRTEPFGDGTSPLLESAPSEAGRKIGIVLMAQVDNRRYFAPYWEALKRDMDALELLRERYPELVSGEEEPLRSMVEFDFVHSISLGLREERVVSKWSMSTRSAEAFARRLHGDARLRVQVADALGEDLAGFDQKAPDALRSAHLLGEFPDTAAISILEGGTAR